MATSSRRAPRQDAAQRAALAKHAHAPAVLRIEPPQCPECKSLAQYFPSSEDFYDGRDFGPVYACLRCDTRCTTHADGTPAGTLAGPELRKARAKVAVLFDPLWNQADRLYPKGANRNHVKRVARDRAYAWLAEQMRIEDPLRCRGHLFDLFQCDAAYRILRDSDITDEKIREWAKSRDTTAAQGEFVGASNARAKAVADSGARGRRNDVSGARQVVSEGRAVRVVRVVRTDEVEEPGRARKAAPAKAGAARRAKAARTPAEKRAAAEAITAAELGRGMRGVTVEGAKAVTDRIHSLQVHTRASTAAAIARAVGKATPPAKRVKVTAAAADAPKKKSQVQKARDEFWLQLRQHGFTDWIAEHRFFKGDEYEPRQWRFDFANLRLKVAVEIEGLVVRRIMTTSGPMTISSGRHANVSGFREDCRKYATAIVDGWFVLRFEQSMIYNREAIAYVERVVARRAYEVGKKVKRNIGKGKR